MTKREAEELKARMSLISDHVDDEGNRIVFMEQVDSVIDSMTDADKPDPRLVMLDAIKAILDGFKYPYEDALYDFQFHDGFNSCVDEVLYEILELRTKIQEESE